MFIISTDVLINCAAYWQSGGAQCPGSSPKCWPLLLQSCVTWGQELSSAEQVEEQRFLRGVVEVREGS